MQNNPNPNDESSMTKRDLVVRISEETGLVQQDVLNVVQKTLDYIGEAVASGTKVELRNFGVFEVKIRKARVGRNPNAPAADVRIPPRAVVKFKPGKEMREAVLRLTPDDAKPAGSVPSASASQAAVQHPAQH
jgi:nucleoid DNA-binding protein